MILSMNEYCKKHKTSPKTVKLMIERGVLQAVTNEGETTGRIITKIIEPEPQDQSLIIERIEGLENMMVALCSHVGVEGYRDNKKSVRYVR